MEDKSSAVLLLEGLRTRVQNAPGTAFSQDKAVLDKKETLQILDRVLEVVENEMKEFQTVTDRKARILEEAKEEAEEVRYQAEKDASRIRVSRRRDGEPFSYRDSELSPAEKKNLRTAGDIYAASLIYTDEMLTEVDHLLQDSLSKIDQEYARMQKTLREKVQKISESKSELVSSLDELTAQDRYAQILELSDLLSNELYQARQKEMSRRREEAQQMQMDLEIPQGKTRVKKKDREMVNPDRTEVKIDPNPTPELKIPVMDRSAEGKGRKESEK